MHTKVELHSAVALSHSFNVISVSDSLMPVWKENRKLLGRVGKQVSSRGTKKRKHRWKY